jgi:TPR repeat protein
MLVSLLASFLLAIPIAISNDLAISLQTTPQTVTGNSPATLSSAEISDLQKRADSGDAAAQFALGKAYESGNGLPKRTDQAAIWYRKAAEQGNEKAQNSLAVLYWTGNGVDKDKAEAVRWYRRAARQGNSNAMFNLGAAYYNGEGVGINDILAYAWFLLSSERGNTSGQDAAKRSQGEHGGAFNDACLAIGQMYEKGEDLPRNPEMAADWYRKAADHGSGEATMRLAALYLQSSDYSRARQWCEAAAKNKNPAGYYCLGYLYQHGFGVDANPREAFRWYQQGAQGGSATAMQAVARMYENGEGTKPDRVQALLWFFFAAQRVGSQNAIAEARRVRLSMTEKEWKEAQKKLPYNFDKKAVDKILQGDSSPAAH